MLVNVEQGDDEPSIATLLRLSGSLGIGLPTLVDVATGRRCSFDDPRTYPDVDQPERRPYCDGGGRRRPNVVELWDWTLGPGDTTPAGARARNGELIAVVQGSLRLRVGDREELLKTGDSATFDADTDTMRMSIPANRERRGSPSRCSRPASGGRS